MARVMRRLLSHEYDELNGYIRMISRYPVMEHAEFARRIREFLPVQRELEAIELKLEPYRESYEDPPASLYKRYAEVLVRRNALREPLVRGNLRLTMTVLHKYVGRGLSILDLIQEGQLGVVRALERFEPDRGFRFSTYAMHWIRSRMGYALREYNSFRVFDLPHHLMEQFGLLVRFSDSFRTKQGRAPNAEELFDVTQASTLHEANRINRKLIRRFLEEPGFGTHTSLDAHINPDDLDSPSFLDYTQDGKAKPESIAAAREALRDFRKEIDRIMGDIPGNDARHALVLRARFGFGEFAACKLTLEEIGKQLDLTRERIRQIEVLALRRKKVSRAEVETLLESVAEIESQLAAHAA